MSSELEGTPFFLSINQTETASGLDKRIYQARHWTTAVKDLKLPGPITAYPKVPIPEVHMNILSKLSVATPLLAAALLMPSMSYAQNSKIVESGSTVVTLSHDFAMALDDLGVSQGSIRPTEHESYNVNFPVIGGAVDLTTGNAEILHSGGMTFKGGGTEVDLSSFIIDTANQMPVISGLITVNHQLMGRVKLFDVTLPAGATLPLKATNGRIAYSGLVVTLDPAAAAALNQAWRVSVFKAGFDIGTAKVVVYVNGSGCEDNGA